MSTILQPIGNEAPAGLPSNGLIRIGRTARAVSISQTVEVFPFVQDGQRIALYESGTPLEADYVDMTSPISYTFSSDGSKRLYAAFMNARGQTLGADQSIYADITIGTTDDIPQQCKNEIVDILRNDTNLQTYATDWDSATRPRVIPGWIDEDAELMSQGNAGRFPHVLVRTGETTREPVGNGYFDLTITIEVQAFIKTTTRVLKESREETINNFLNAIEQALDEFPTLNNPAVKQVYASSKDPTWANGKSYRAGLIEFTIDAGAPLQCFNTQ